MKKAIWFPVLVVAALMGGCGKEGEKKAATQVAAKVNGDEITVHQVNAVLSRTPNLPPEQAEPYKRQALERLIDQHLAKQQAVEKKLDRTPRTVQAVEAARNEILARSYFDQIASAQPKPTAEEVKKYYAENRELFAERRIFSVEELIVLPKGVPVDAVKAQAAKAKDLPQLAAWLRSQKAEVAARRGVRAAEQMPMAWLPQMQSMKDGQVAVFESGDRLNVVRVVTTRAAAVDEATARPRIEQFLFNRRLNELLASEIKHLREKSNIEYMGEFAEAPKTKTQPEPEAFEPEPAAPAAPNFEKGIRGLR
jgi:EpsD family peptidyl-prolyl cis-trans isomerase